MRTFITFTIFLFYLNNGIGQCYPDRHNTSWFDGWISCDKSENPNNKREESHWISYDFGKPYQLNELKIWNINDPDLLDYGAKTVMIDYSVDGLNWIEHGLETFPKAPGNSRYEGNQITHFNGIKARFLLITIVENYGGDCTGFSELRVEVDTAKDEQEDICIIADIYPNPFESTFTVFLEKKCLGETFIAVEDVSGRTVIEESVIKLYDSKNIDGQHLLPGIYYVCLRNGEIKERYKIVKL